MAANGGFLSKYSVGVYSTAARPFTPFDSKPLQQEIDAWPAPALDEAYVGPARIETYTIDYSGPAPKAVIIGRTPADVRVVAMVPAEDAATIARLIAEEPLGGQVTLSKNEAGRNVAGDFQPA